MFKHRVTTDEVYQALKFLSDNSYPNVTPAEILLAIANLQRAQLIGDEMAKMHLDSWRDLNYEIRELQKL